MTSGILANATDLALWANRRDSQDVLPRLVRRLVHATTEHVLRAGFPAGEGVQLGGWDGIVEVEQGNAYVPAGVSVWELGVNKKLKEKADSDYEERSSNPLGVIPSESTFLFVTPRRWGAKREWESKRRKDTKWRDVRVYDADDLEEWLDTAPAVHTWISILLGKQPEGAEDLTAFWGDWTAMTSPAMSADLVLAGRLGASEAIHKWLETRAAPLALHGESRAESLAVFAATVQKLPANRQVEVLARTVIVRDVAAWNRLCASESKLILVQNFESDKAISRAAQRGHAAVLMLGRADSMTPNAVEITRIASEQAREALIAMGAAKDKAGDLAVLARRSLMSLRRKLAISPAVVQPRWASPENAQSLLPALLAGRWSDQTDADQAAIAHLAGTSFINVNRGFVRWINEDDPPLRCVGSAWYLSSEEDAWALLGRYLTRGDLERFEQVVLEVLGVHDPALDLPNEKRWYAGILGRKRAHSGLLQAGLANTLALMGARGDAIRTTDGSLRDTAVRCVHRLLDTTDWRVWASLPLPLLGEAAPTEFLSAVERGVRGEAPLLVRVLAAETEEPLFGSSPHVGLLWALESLAWSEQFLARSALALATLTRLDPGGKLANRPLASLEGIFLPWFPQTAASLDTRLHAIDSLRRQEPDVAWKVMLRSLPKYHDVEHPSARPQWQEWAPEREVRVLRSEYSKTIDALVARILEDVGLIGTRWAQLIESLPQLPPREYETTVTTLMSLDPTMFLDADLAAIWHALRALISTHRSFSDADWALPEEQVSHLQTLLGRFEPHSVLETFGWLFGDRPVLLEGREDDWENQEKMVIARQDDAIQTLCQDSDLTWLSEFVSKVDRPELLGSAIARNRAVAERECDLFNEYLHPEVPNRRRFIAGFVNQRVRADGFEWAAQKLSGVGRDWTSAQRALFCACLPFRPDTWDAVEGLDAESVRQYWQTVSPFFVDSIYMERVVGRLLDYGRPHVAVHLLGHDVRRGTVPAELAARALQELLAALASADSAQNVSAHEISDLLEVVSASPDLEPSQAAALEWAFLPAVGRHIYTPKLLHQELAQNPEFFAQIVGMVYREEGAEPRESSEEESARARHGYELLETWRSPPGSADGPRLDATALRDWVLKARDILRAERRLAIGDHTIGQVLSSPLVGDDGAWPRPAIRDLIEELASEDFEQGLVNGLLNSEGVSCRNPNEGGTRERATGEKHDRFANIVASRWPRTAAMLRGIRDHYFARALNEDRNAELRRDLLL